MFLPGLKWRTKMDSCDLVIIGTGPAGMSAAATAAAHGLEVLLLDEQKRAGGQIYRDVGIASQSRGKILGQEYLDGLGLVDSLANGNIRHVTGATVWSVEQDGTIAWSAKDTASMVRSNRVLLATGALERPVPVPGWTLPGVMTAGAAQILLKQSSIVPRHAVIAGTGPLIYLVAAQMIRAGTPPLALVETQARSQAIAALFRHPGALKAWPQLLKGMDLLGEIRRANVPRHLAATNLRVEGDERAMALTFNSRGADHKIACETVLLHQGVVPNTQISRALDLEHYWHSGQAAFLPVTDEWGRSSQPEVFIAGDGMDINGAVAARWTGALAALRIAADLGKINDQQLQEKAKPVRNSLHQERSIRPFLERVRSCFV